MASYDDEEKFKKIVKGTTNSPDRSRWGGNCCKKTKESRHRCRATQAERGDKIVSQTSYPFWSKKWVSDRKEGTGAQAKKSSSLNRLVSEEKAERQKKESNFTLSSGELSRARVGKTGHKG